MKKILFITLPLLFSVGFSQKKKINEPNLMKGVKTQTKVEYEYKDIFGKANWFPKETTISIYDPNGNIFEQKNYKGDQHLEDINFFRLKYLYKYNSKGNIIDESLYFADGSTLKKYITKYDSNENLVEQIHYNSEGVMAYDYKKGFAKCIYKYDSKGNMVERAAYKTDGSLESKSIYKYDSKGDVVENLESYWVYESFEPNVDYYTKFKYKYDSKGNKVERAVYKTDGSLESKSIYTYDLKGNEVERAVYIDGSLKSKDISTFNTENRISEKITYSLELKFGEFRQRPMTKTNYEYDLY